MMSQVITRPLWLRVENGQQAGKSVGREKSSDSGYLHVEGGAIECADVEDVGREKFRSYCENFLCVINGNRVNF